MRRYLFALVIVCFTSGCVYYNTFFLARKKFEEAEKSQRQNAESRQKQGQSGPGQPGRPGKPGQSGSGDDRPGQKVRQVSQQERMLYEDAIKKASKVLKFHPDSKWVDDALWLIGKAYFNMGDYLQADRKFKELVTNHPKSKFADDSYYYMGLSQIQLGRGELALEAFDRLKAGFPKSGYVEDVYFVRAKIARDEGKFAEAVDLFDEYLRRYPKGDSAAEAIYYSGQCIEETGDHVRAYLRFSEIEKHKPSRELYFDAALAGASVVLRTDSIGVGMKILDELAGDEKYFDYSSKIQLKIAEGHSLQGQIDEAIARYAQVTEQSPKSLEAAEAYYRLGLIYQTELFDLKKAKDAFSKAQSENPSSEFRNLALARSAQIAKLEAYQMQLQRADSVLTAEQSREQKTEVPADSIDTLKTMEFEDPPAAENKAGPDRAGSDKVADGDILSGEHSDSVFTVPLENSGRLLYGPMETGSDEAVSNRDSAALAGGAGTEPGQGEGDRNENISAEDEIARQDSIRQDIINTGIETRYLLAELYAYDLNRPDSAIREFLQIADQYSSSVYAPRSLLACASLELKRGDSTSARGYFRRVLNEHPLSPQASLAAEHLGLQIDPSRNARGMYAHAERLALDEGRLDSAIAIFTYIADNFPDLAPQASFAIAWALEKAQTTEDSSAYYAYNRVCERYPQSVYAAAARTKMGQGSTAQPLRRPGRPGEPGKEEEEGVPDPDSLRQLALGLQSAPPVRKLEEFVYPERLLDRQLKGQVLFKIRLNIFGKVEEYEIIGPSGEYAIDSAATESLLKTEFDTSRLDLSQLDGFFKYSIRFERPDINIFNDPYLQERRDQY